MIKLNNRALQESLYELIQDPESIHKLSTKSESDEHRIVYRKNSKETSFIEKTEDKMKQDYESLITLLNLVYKKIS